MSEARSGALLNIQNMQQVRTDAVSGTRDWTRVSTVFQSGAATKLEINCLFGGWGTSTGQAWYDDIALEQVEAPPEDTQATVTIDTGAGTMPYQPDDLRRLSSNISTDKFMAGCSIPVRPLRTRVASARTSSKR